MIEHAQWFIDSSVKLIKDTSNYSYRIVCPKVRDSSSFYKNICLKSFELKI